MGDGRCRDDGFLKLVTKTLGRREQRVVEPHDGTQVSAATAKAGLHGTHGFIHGARDIVLAAFMYAQNHNRLAFA